MPYTVDEFLSFIEDANSDECEAIRKYFLLIDAYKKTIFESPHLQRIADKYIREVIERLIPEEMQHRIILSDFSSELSKIEPEKD